MIALGIDFGTSNCCAFFANGDRMVAIPLEDESPLLPSVVFTARREIAIKQIEVAEFSRRLKSAQAAAKAANRRARAEGSPEHRIDDLLLRKQVEEAMRREAADEQNRQYWDQSFFSMLNNTDAVLFGTPALRAYIGDPLGGTLLKSPKSFIGSDLKAEQLSKFQVVITQMLSHILAKARIATGQDITHAVIGRPIVYHGVMGESGNKQAIQLMEAAAHAAGIKHVAFYMEPLAAALEFEKTISREQIVLVVDIGGGTTDCAVIRLKPASMRQFDRTEDILGVSGDRVGGTDFDQDLAWRGFMPLLGKDKVPHSILYDAISTRNVPAQLRFKSAGYRIDQLIRSHQDLSDLERLKTLHLYQLQHRLLNSAELTKLKLSEVLACTVPLGYLEETLSQTVTRQDFLEYSSMLLSKIQRLVQEAISAAKIRPDTVFLTGGMGAAPIVRDVVRQACGPDIPIVSGDMLASVGKGLGESARLAFA